MKEKKKEEGELMEKMEKKSYRKIGGCVGTEEWVWGSRGEDGEEEGGGGEGVVGGNDGEEELQKNRT